MMGVIFGCIYLFLFFPLSFPAGATWATEAIRLPVTIIHFGRALAYQQLPADDMYPSFSFFSFSPPLPLRSGRAAGGGIVCKPPLPARGDDREKADRPGPQVFSFFSPLFFFLSLSRSSTRTWSD